MTQSIFSKNSMTFPEITENFKITENPWLFHDRGNPASLTPGNLSESTPYDSLYNQWEPGNFAQLPFFPNLPFLFPECFKWQLSFVPC